MNLEIQDAAWGWYQQQYKYHILHASKALRALFGAVADEPLGKLEALLNHPGKGMKLTSDLQSPAQELAEGQGSIPMRGIPVIEIVSPRQASLLLSSRCGQEASRRYRTAISRTLTTPELNARYPALETILRELLRAMAAFMYQQLKQQVPKQLLSIVMANEQVYMLAYFWFICNYRFHPVLAGIEQVRALGGYVLWFNQAGNATLLMAEPPTPAAEPHSPPAQEQPFVLDMDAFVEDDET